MPTFFTGSSKLVRATTSATLHTIASTDNAAGVVNLRNDAAAHAFAVLDDATGALPDRRVVIAPGKSVKLARGVKETTLKITNASVLATPGYLRKNDKFREFTNLSNAARNILRIENLIGRHIPLITSLDFEDCSAVVRDYRSKNNYIGDVNGLLSYPSSTKYIVGANGFYYPGDTIRTERDRFGALLGARIEESAQNLVFPSVPFPSTGIWGQNNNTLIERGYYSIFNDYNAIKISAVSSAAATFRSTGTATVTSTSCCASWYVKKGSGPTNANRFTIRNDTTATNLNVFTINYDTLVITHTTGSGATATRLGNDWILIQCPQSSGITSGDSISLYCCFTGSVETAGEYAYVSHVQLEPGRTFATSPIVTTTAAVTRNDDNIFATNGMFPTNATGYTYYSEFSTFSPTNFNDYRFLIGTTNSRGIFVTTGNGRFSCGRVFTNDAVIISPTIIKDVTYSGAGVLSSSGVKSCLNGGTVVENTEVSSATGNLTIGGQSTVRFLYGHMKVAMFIPEEFTNSELQAITQRN